MRHVVLTWIFGTWRRETLAMRRRRALALARLAQRRLLRCFHAWLSFLRGRRVLGAMLLAEQERRATAASADHLAALHGQLHAAHASASVAAALHADERTKLIGQRDALQHTLRQRNSEMAALRRELLDARGRVAQLEAQSIDPAALARLQSEHADAKKMVAQLGAALVHALEAPLEALATTPSLASGVLSKDVAALLERPEHPALFNPLVALTGGNSTSTSFDAPVDRADRILLQWANSMVQRGPPEWLQLGAAPRVANFGASLSDGRALTLLAKTLYGAMSRQRPPRRTGTASSSNTTSTTTAKLEATSVLRDNGEELTEIAMERFTDHVRREESASRRLELTIRTLGQALWLPVGLLDAKDVAAGDAELNFAALSYLFCTAAPWPEDAQLALANDLKAQLAALKNKWREVAPTAPNSNTGINSNTGSINTTTASSEDDVPRLKLALAQTLEFKKKVDAEDAKTREGHALWWRSARVVLRKSFVSFARLARGKAGVLAKLEAAADESEAFARAPPRQRLADIELPFEDAAWESKLLQSYLGGVHCDLARIYRGYATRSDPGSTHMTVGDLTELLTECKVLDAAAFPAADVQAIVKKVADASKTPVNAQRSLPPSEYIEALVRVARRKYTGEHHRVTLSEAFCLLVDNCVLPFAFRADADLFQQQLEDTKIRRLLLKFADELRDLYNAYAVEAGPSSSTSTAGGRRRPRVTAFSFSQCLLDRGVLDVAFNSEKVLGVVQRVARTAKKEGLDPGGEELTFEEFQEALVVAACYKFPDPYSSLESRLEKFLTGYVRGGAAPEQ